MTCDALLAMLRDRVDRTTRVDDVAALMAPLASDSAWVHLGGSGTRQQIFRIGARQRAVFEFDGDDRLVAYGAYDSSGTWPEEMPVSDGLILV